MELMGFGAFREATSLDFTDADFFALVGPTGSGKSTVIDAVCFVLYGSVPRYEDKRMNRYVVTLGASEARVSVTFDLESSRYTATRVVRRNARGEVSTKEARLERIGPDGGSSVVAGAEREMNGAVEELIGLTFEDFTRCVALPQGEFARFLRAKGEERRELLLRLLNLAVYRDVAALASRRAETAKSAAEMREQALSDLVEATPEALRAAKARAKSLRELASEAKRARPDIDGYRRQAEGERRLQAQAVQLHERLVRVEVPIAARLHAQRLASASEEIEIVSGVVEAAEQHRLAMAAAMAAFPHLVELKTIARAHEELVGCGETIARSEAELAAAETAEGVAGGNVVAAEATEGEARTALQALRVAHAADDLAQHLVAGQACPVCQQVVSVLPGHGTLSRIEPAESALQLATQALADARSEQRRCSEAVARLGGRLAEAVASAGRLEAQVTSQPDRPALAALITDVETAEAALETARAGEDLARQDLKAKALAREALAIQTRSLQASFDAARDEVAVLSPPQAGRADLLADWEAFAAWAADAAAGQLDAAKAAGVAATDHDAAAIRLESGLAEGCECLGVDPGSDVFTAIIAAGLEAHAAVEAVAKAIEDAKRLRSEIAGYTEQAEVAGMLRTMLRADRFPEWLLAEALELLVEDASSTLMALTNGAFSLDLGAKEFMVIDHGNADEARSARTLSGGETFQASLALALALSDQIRNLAADGAPRLDALFLDEGFGTLDPETLDVVAASIENLGQSGRMVGVITHVRELAMRVPVRFEVRKGLRSSSVERVNA
jgi:exonuclease SbcC